MTYLLDTNILLRWADKSHPQNVLVDSALVSLHRQGEVLSICPQSIVEFWAVATRPKLNNGLGWTLMDTRLAVIMAQGIFDFLADPLTLYDTWFDLVTRYGVAGKNVHDARIAAFAISHGIPNLLTINIGDFKRFTELNTVHPQDVPLIP